MYGIIWSNLQSCSEAKLLQCVVGGRGQKSWKWANVLNGWSLILHIWYVLSKSYLMHWPCGTLSPNFSTNVANAVNFQVNFINLHHSLQGLKLSYLQLIFEEDVNFDLDVIQNLIFVHHLHHHLHHYLLTSLFTWHFTAKLDFFHDFHHYLHHYLLTSLFTSNFTAKLKF